MQHFYSYGFRLAGLCLLTFWFSCNTASTTPTCTPENDGKTFCIDNAVVFCHGKDTKAPHFHNDQDCEQQQLQCVSANDQAYCVDTQTTCEGTTSECKDNQALNCVNGNFAVERCGSIKTCAQENGRAVCKAANGQSCPDGQVEVEHAGKKECKKSCEKDEDCSGDKVCHTDESPAHCGEKD
ncbi:MAG: hypothetical protein AAGJ35_00200 [Myxococcota bacterium]